MPSVSVGFTSSEEERGRIVMAPGEVVLLRAATRTIDVRLVGEEAPVRGLDVEVTGTHGGGGGGATFDANRVLVRISADVDARITVSAEGRRSATAFVRAGEELEGGILWMELEPLPPPAILALDLESLGLPHPLELRCSLRRVAPEPERADEWVEPVDPYTTLDFVAPGRGLVEVGSVESGRYLGSLSARDAELAGMILPCSLKLDLRAGGRVVHPVRLELGGRFELEVVDDGSDEERLTLRLLDAAGEQLEWRASPKGSVYLGSGQATVWPAVGRSETAPPLAPGDYRLLPSLGRRELEPVAFTIRRGEVTEVRIDPRR